MAKTTESTKMVPVMNGNVADKQKSLTEAVARMEKTFGKGSIMRLGERSPHESGHHADRFFVARCGAGRRFAQGPFGRNLRRRGRRQDDLDAALHRRMPEEGRHLRLY